jgi:arylsulfatase A-like enzyme
LLPVLLWLFLVVVELLSRHPYNSILLSAALQRAVALAVVAAAGIAGVIVTVSSVAARFSTAAVPKPLAAGAVGSVASALAMLMLPMCDSQMGGSPETRFAILIATSCVMAMAVVMPTLRLTPGRALAMAWCLAALALWTVAVAVRFDVAAFDARAAGLAAGAGLFVLGVLFTRIAPDLAVSTRRATRVTLCLAAGLALALAGFVREAGSIGGRGGQRTDRRWNVLVVCIDTLRADHTNPGGYALDTTPTLASLLAPRATWFSQAVAAAASTAPSVKSLFTALPPSHLGDEHLNAPPSARAWTMAEAFRTAGYRTALVAANELLTRPGFTSGFERSWIFGGYSYFTRSLLLFDLLSGEDYRHALKRMRQRHVHKEAGDTVQEVAGRWMEANRGAPFFLYVHLVDPHWPFYDRGFGLVPADVRSIADPYADEDLILLPPGDSTNAERRSRPQMRETVGRYDEEVRLADETVRHLMGHLRRLDLDDHTMVVITADHGEEFLEHDGFGHGHDVFEEQVRVPLLFRWPADAKFHGLAPEVSVPVSLMDVFPTFVDYLDLVGPTGFLGGASLRPLFEGTTDRWHPVTSEASFPGKYVKAYREGALKVRFVHAESGGVASAQDVRVYDLARDPAEMRPLDEDDVRVGPLVERARGHLKFDRHRRLR